MNKIKILHVQLTKNYGGIESLLCNIYKKIDRNDFQFDFIANGKANYQKQLNNLGANIFYMPSIKDIFLYKKTFDSILNNDYNIVHFHKNSLANCLPIIWARHHPTHPKIIIHSHNSSPSINNKALFYLHDLNKYLLNSMPDYKIACSKKAANWMFTSNSKVKILYNGINTDEFKFSDEKRNKIRKKLHISKNTLVFIHVGRFSKQKNHQYLIKLFHQLVKIHPDSKLLLLGEGELKEKIQLKVREDQLIKNKVLFLGLQQNVSDYLSASDIFLFPSLYEGFPVSIIEAECNGLIIFKSNTITNEVNVENCVNEFSLTDNIKIIAQNILDIFFSSTNNIREKKAKIMENSDFNLYKMIKKLSYIYRYLVGTRYERN